MIISFMWIYISEGRLRDIIFNFYPETPPKSSHWTLYYDLAVPLCHPPWFPASSHHVLSEESDNILKECSKDKIPLPQLLLFKNTASLVLWRGWGVSD